MKKIIEKIIIFLQNDTVERVYKTFFQAFIGVILAVNMTDIKDMTSIKTIVISGLIAGVCAVWNLLKTYIDNRLKKLG